MKLFSEEVQGTLILLVLDKFNCYVSMDQLFTSSQEQSS